MKIISPLSMPGFLLIDKPAGPTSHDVVDRVRRITGQRRVGHAGTLDPFATGLLIVGVERGATREMQKLSGLDKTYVATFVLGAMSDTDDKEGKIEKVGDASSLTSEQISEAMKPFVGEIDQIPPAYAAIKINGKKMYEAARAGKPIEAPPRHVRVDRFELLEYLPPARGGNEGGGSIEHDLTRIRVVIDCSSGTYVRSLARDLGKSLGVGGYAEELRRTRIGVFETKESISLKDLNKDNFTDHLLPVEELLNRLVK